MGNFILERAKSLVSKKIGATIVAEVALVGGAGANIIPPGVANLPLHRRAGSR